MKNKPTSPPPFALPAAFLALASESVLLDPASRYAIATDGEAIALHPLPEHFTEPRLLSRELVGLAERGITPDSGTPTTAAYDLDALKTTPAYRIALNPTRLLALAAALQSEELVVIAFPANPEEGPMLVLPDLGGARIGYLMPQPMPNGDKEGLLTETGAGISPESLPSKIQNPSSNIAPPALPPPTVLVSERNLIEVDFHGRPDKEILQAIGREGIGFSYSGRGTKKGVPPAVWYAPNNEWFRMEIQKLLKVQVQAAA